MTVAAEQGGLTWSPALEECRFPRMGDVYRYWQSRRNGRQFPARANIDPLDMRGALGNIALTEVHRSPLRFRLRLVGSNMTARLGFDPTGMWVDETPVPEYGRVLIERMKLILERREALLVCNRQFMDNRWYDYESLWLPLAADGETIDILLSCQFFADAPEGEQR